MNDRNGFLNILLGVIISVILIGAGGYFVLQKIPDPSGNLQLPPPTSAQNTSEKLMSEQIAVTKKFIPDQKQGNAASLKESSIPSSQRVEVASLEVESNSRDSQRIGDIKRLQLGLELYFDKNNTYPKSLEQLVPQFVAQIPLDPLDKKSYQYTVPANVFITGGQTVRFLTYHLGASLEGMYPQKILLIKDWSTRPANEMDGISPDIGDMDCNSITGAGCPASNYEQATAFDGSDGKGCLNEMKRHCYDVSP